MVKSKKRSIIKFVAFVLTVCVLAGVGYYLYTYTNVLSKILKKKYDITFIVEGEEYVQKVEYDAIPEFEGTLTKEPTTTIEYAFDGWEPELEKVFQDATYTAKFKEQERLYSVNLTTNYENAGVYQGFGKIYPYMSEGEISVDVNEGYNFLGWFVNGEFQSLALTMELVDISQDITIEAKFSTIKKSVIYNNMKGAQNSNIEEYDITNGIFNLQPLSANGYEFNGWYTGENATGEKIEAIDSANLQDYTLYADWSIINYLISYDLHGAAAVENRTTYNVETASFILVNPTKPGSEFIGWIGTGLTNPSKLVVIERGSFGNRNYIACFEGDERTVTLNVDGKVYDTFDTYVGDVLTKDLIDINFVPQEYGMAGYSVKKWYSDSTLNSEYDFNSTIVNNVTIYAKFEYVLNEIYFYPYISDFEIATRDLLLEVDNREVLVAWIDYVRFYDINQVVNLKLNYISKNAQLIMNELTVAYNELIGKTSFQTSSTIQKSANSLYGKMYISDSFVSEEANYVLDPEKQKVYPQQDFAIRVQNENPREVTFDDFNLKQVINEVKVSTTEQLVHVIQSGYEPICIAGSDADIIYNKAKAVLREICNDQMSDFDKLRAIYEWLVLNVEYDYAAVELASIESDVSILRRYDSWYAEGVFNNGKAVCEGYAKAFIIMSGLENIPSVIVTGDGHAWNRVMLDNKWYGIDATHGSPTINFGSGIKYEFLTYTSFLFSDSYKSGVGYTSDDYDEFIANNTNVFNTYDLMEYNYKSQAFDLYINSVQELALVFDYVNDYSSEFGSNYITFELVFASNISNISSAIMSANSIAGTSVLQTYSEPDAFGNRVYSLRISA